MSDKPPRKKKRLIDVLLESRAGDTSLEQAAAIADEICALPRGPVPSVEQTVNAWTNGEQTTDKPQTNPGQTVSKPRTNGEQTPDKPRANEQTNPGQTVSKPQASEQTPGKWANGEQTLSKPHFTGAQESLLEYLAPRRRAVVSVKVLASELGVPYGTLRRSIAGLEAAGYISAKGLKTGRFNGTMLALMVEAETLSKPWTNHEQTMGKPQTNSEQALDEQRANGEQTPALHPQKIDRERLSLSISSRLLNLSKERMAMNWPSLVSRGFGPEQIAQIVENLEALGKSLDNVVVSLDHAEWELEHDAMLDKDNRPVDDPCAWVFRSLFKTGYYRRPKGYVSPGQQAELDRAEEAKAVAEARTKADELEFSNWEASLPPAERERIVRAKKGNLPGPDRPVLLEHWRRNVKAVQVPN